MINVNYDGPYEVIIHDVTEKEYARNQTEVVLVNKGIAEEMRKIKFGEMKTIRWQDFKKKHTMK